ncbi:ABC transporter substrate-binding protein [Nocardioides cynanchi]|uniref:ABC transporter substrate-binding protein n=1 Tax=Nocardioides cynanchi TaxID=2558918 RepID=UPI0012478DA9|nr:ABC transporter substrate-binding protein [Nocardioides cynanchi]
MHFKRTLALTGALALTAALAACGSSNSSAPSAGTGASGAPKIGDCTVTGKPNSISITPVSAGTLTVETTLPAPGWWDGTTPDSINGGYEYCMAANLAYMAGLTSVTVKNVSFDQLVAGRTNTFDLALAEISITPERAKVVDFSKPYYDSNIGVIVKKGADVTESNITTKSCAAYAGTTSVTFLQDQLKCASTKIYPNSSTLYQSVLSGQADAAFLDTAIVLGEAKKTGGQLEVVGQYSTGEKYGAIYPQGSANEDALNQGIATMLSDGTLDGLSKQWLGPAFGGDPSSVPVWAIQ